jgi:DNA invertase Pin-like site-specific DNA recombinase
MDCALYCRVSTTDQDCAVQLRELREYASRRHWSVAAEYIDTGFSGVRASRPALDQLMAEAAQRRFDCVLVWKLDRFGRSVLHLNQQLAALTSYGIRFIATTQGLDTDSSHPTSRLLLQILASVAEFEREMIRERTLVGIRMARANGKHLGRPKRVFRRDEVVRLRDREGLSWRVIATRLNVPTTTVLNAYREYCSEIVPSGCPAEPRKNRG